MLFILGQIVVAGWLIAPFGTEWSDAVSVSDAVLGWIAVVLLGASPFVAVLVVLVFARPAGLIWWSGVVFTVLAGAFGVWVDVDMLTLDDPLAALGFFFLPAYQWAVLLPAALIMGVIVGVRRRRRERGGVRDDRETRRPPTGNSFDRG